MSADVADGGTASFDSLRPSRNGASGVLWNRFREFNRDEEIELQIQPLSAYLIEITGIPIEITEGEEPLNDQLITAPVAPLFTKLESPSWLIADVVITGSIAPQETAQVQIPCDDGSQKWLEDVFTLDVPSVLPTALSTDFELDSLNGIDLDLAILDSTGEVVERLGASPDPGDSVLRVALTAGRYYVGVIRVDDTGVDTAGYQLRITPSGS